MYTTVTPILQFLEKSMDLKRIIYELQNTTTYWLVFVNVHKGLLFLL